MAIVPRGTENVRMNVSSPVPIGSTESARIAGESLSAFGKGLEQFGQQQLEIDRTLKRDEAESEYKTLNNDAHMYAQKKVNPDGSNYAEKYQEHYNSKKDEILGRYAGNDPRLQRQIGSMAQVVSNHGMSQAIVRGMEIQKKFNDDRFDNVVAGRVDRTRANPELASSELKALSGTITEMQAGGMNSMEAAHKLELGKRQLALAYVDGLGNQKRFQQALNALTANQEDAGLFTDLSPDKARTMGLITAGEANSLRERGENYKVPVYTKGDKVKLTPELSVLMQSFTPQEKAHLIDQMRAKAQSETQLRLSDIHAKIEGIKDIMQYGNQADVDKVGKMLEKLRGEVASFPNMNADEKSRTLARIDTEVAVGEQLRYAQALPKNEWSKAVSRLEENLKDGNSDPAIVGARAEARHRFVKQLQSLDLERERNGDLAARMAFPSLQQKYLGTKDKHKNPEGAREYLEYLDISAQAQRYLGINDIKLVESDEAEGMVAHMKTATDPAQLNEYIGTVQEKFGKHAGTVMNQLAKIDKDVADYRVILNTPPHQRNSIVDAVMNKASINKSFADGGALKGSTEDLHSAVNNVLRDYKSSLLSANNNSSGQEYLNSLSEQITLLAKRDLNKSPDANVTDVVTNAYNKVIGGNYLVVSENNSKIVIPRRIEGANISEQSAPIFKSYMSVNGTRMGFRRLGVQAPPAYKAMTEEELKNYPSARASNKITSEFPKAGEVTGEDVYYEWLEKSHRWVPNEGLTGVKLMALMPDGNLDPVINKEGKLIEASYKDIYFNPGEIVERQSKNFLGRLFGN